MDLTLKFIGRPKVVGSFLPKFVFFLTTCEWRGKIGRRELWLLFMVDNKTMSCLETAARDGGFFEREREREREKAEKESKVAEFKRERKSEFEEWEHWREFSIFDEKEGGEMGRGFWF